MGFWGHLLDFWYHLLGFGVICWGFGVLVDFYWGFVVILGVFGAICCVFGILVNFCWVFGVICWVFGILVDFYWGFGVILGVFGAICWLFVAIRRIMATPLPSASPPTELRALPSLRPPANCSGAHGGGAGGPGAGGGGLAGGAELRLHLAGRGRRRHRALHHPHRRHPHRRAAPRQRLGPIVAMATGAVATAPHGNPGATRQGSPFMRSSLLPW